MYTNGVAVMYANIDANAMPPHSMCPHATGSRSSLPYAANDCSTAELARFSRGQVSGTRRNAVTAQTAPKIVSVTNTARQPPSRSNWPPISGASNGPIDVKIASIDSTRAASVGSWASRAIARASTEAAPAPSACTKRNNISEPIENDSAHATLASTYITIPPSSTGRRPNESDNGPYSSMPIEKPNMKLVSVDCAAPAATENAWAIDGRLGRYMSMEIGPHAASAPSNRISRPSGRRLTT